MATVRGDKAWIEQGFAVIIGDLVVQPFPGATGGAQDSFGGASVPLHGRSKSWIDVGAAFGDQAHLQAAAHAAAFMLPSDAR